MADWEWIEKFVTIVRGFGAPEASDFSELPEHAPVAAAVQGMYAPHPNCALVVDEEERTREIDHGASVLPFTPTTFLIAGLNSLGFLTGAMRIGAPWTSEPGIVHVEHFDGPVILHRFNTDLTTAFDAIRLDADTFDTWYNQHRVTFQ